MSQRGLIDLDLTEAVSFNPSALSFSIFCPFIDFFFFFPISGVEHKPI